MIDQAIGWWRPRGAVTWHFFLDGVSLCEGWFTSLGRLLVDRPRGVRICLKCAGRFEETETRQGFYRERRGDVGWVWPVSNVFKHYVRRTRAICGLARFSGRVEDGRLRREVLKCWTCVEAVSERVRIVVHGPAIEVHYERFDATGPVRERG